MATKTSRPLKRDDAPSPSAWSEGAAFRGRAPLDRPESPKLPGVGIDYDFRIMVHPDQWDVVIDGDGKADVLPILAFVRGRPGLDGCVTMNRVEDRIAAYRKRGFIEVEDGPVEAFGETVPSYRSEYDVEAGVHYTTAWRRPRVFSGQTRWTHDRDGENAFRRRVKVDIFGGQVPADALAALRQMITDLHETSLDGRKSVLRELTAKTKALEAVA